MYKLSVPGVNFTKILSAAFMRKDLQNAKIDTDDMTVFFTLLGSVCVKAVIKMMVKLTPVVNFINILRGAFATNIILPKNY